MLQARLHPIWVPEVGYRYSVIFRGKLLVKHSRDPECETARALLAKGFIGKLTGETVAARRVAGSIGAAVTIVMQGVQVVRVHDVAETRQALAVWQAAMHAGEGADF